MKITLKFASLLAVLALASCAGKHINETSKDKEDLVKVFNLEDDKFKKFIIKKKSTQEVIEDSKDSNESKVIENNQKKIAKESKKEIKKEVKKSSQPSVKKAPAKKVKPLKKKEKAPKAAVPEKEVVVSKEEKVEAKPVVKQVINPETLDDYPKNFKKYNKKYGKYWKQYKKTYFPGEKFTIQISWALFNAGTATIETLGDLEVGEKEAVGFKAVLKSAEYFENIYTLKDTLTTYVTKSDFLPLKYVMKQRESGQNVDDLQLFDVDNAKTYFWYKRIKEGKVKEKTKESYTPKYFHDSFSALQFMRGMPFKVGNKFEFPVVTRTKVWLLKAKITKKEKIKVMDKYVSAYKVSAETHFPGVLKKRGDIDFWFSADERKLLLKFEAKIKIGKVQGILIDYKAGKKQ